MNGTPQAEGYLVVGRVAFRATPVRAAELCYDEAWRAGAVTLYRTADSWDAFGEDCSGHGGSATEALRSLLIAINSRHSVVPLLVLALEQSE